MQFVKKMQCAKVKFQMHSRLLNLSILCVSLL